MNIQPIEETYNTYLFLKDALKISARGIQKSYFDLFPHTEYFGLTYKDAIQKKEFSQKELEDLIVLSLFANFERQLRDEIIQKSDVLKTVLPITLSEKLYKRTTSEIDFWKITDILDIFATTINSSITGNLKQVNEYRNWIAHGRNQTNLPSAQIDPSTTYSLIRDFMSIYNSI